MHLSHGLNYSKIASCVVIFIEATDNISINNEIALIGWTQFDMYSCMHYAAFHLGPHYLRKNSFRGFLNTRCVTKIFFLFLDQSVCYGYSLEPTQCDGFFENLTLLSKRMGKKTLTIYA